MATFVFFRDGTALFSTLPTLDAVREDMKIGGGENPGDAIAVINFSPIGSRQLEFDAILAVAKLGCESGSIKNPSYLEWMIGKVFAEGVRFGQDMNKA